MGGLALACVLAGCGRHPGAAKAPRLPTGARAAGAQGADDGQWVMPAHDYASTRYSGLDEITTQNVGRLRLAWTFETGVTKGEESAPLIVGSTMYIITAYPDILYAIDLAHPGVARWTFNPHPAAAAQGVACCDVVNRGVAYADGRIFMNTLDGWTIAVDANTGRPAWRTHLADINRGETITMAPLVVKNHVLVGNSGGEMGVRGWLAALNTANGSVAWKAYSTGPDSEVLIGADFHPFYPSDQGADLGVTSWPADHWKIGGAAPWGWVGYDPQLNLIYYGTSNPGTWNPDLRPGDNKWASTLFARDADNGQARWAYQLSPHDEFDYDGVNENILLDLPVGGDSTKLRQVLVHPDRNGFMYVLDRATGQVLSADTFVHETAYTGVDLRTGRPTPNADMEPHTGQTARGVCPSSSGGKDWQPSAFSPRTGLLYVPHQNLCMDYEGVQANYIEGTPYVGANVRMYAGPGGNRGVFGAWDPVGRRWAWQIAEDFPVWSGALATAGDVVFYGTMDGFFKAVDARTGAPLWSYKVGSGVIGQPVSYRAPDGHQYVAVLSGVGGWAGAIVSGDLDPRDPTAAAGFVNAMSDLPQHTTRGGTLYVFALPS